MILELGSGQRPTFLADVPILHLDIVEGPHVEIVCDLNLGIPLPSNLFDQILALDVIEHLHSVVDIMNEMHRVLHPDGIAMIRVPKFGGWEHRLDPTHVRGFEMESFDYFCDGENLTLGSEHGKFYTKRRWAKLNVDASLVGTNLCFELQAIKPNEVPRDPIETWPW